MIRIEDGWKASRYGLCHTNIDCNGWFQRQASCGKIELEVRCDQTRLQGIFPSVTQNILRGKVDTGSPVTVISRALFQESGFRVPHSPPSIINEFSGVIQQMGKEGCLHGWQDVPLRVSVLSDWSKEDLKLPPCDLRVVVAENVAQHKFLLGLDFLQRFKLLLEGDFLVMISK